ncbi:MAG: tetratricopeptide repeat protein [Ignavibacteria bacterium]|nr:tetratricopeptide repeat protein [Ignavibacteria bacterium]
MLHRKILLLLVLFGSVLLLHAQTNPDALRSEAQQMMQRGRYGEAIDLLNKYISARPSYYDGYTLRGLCYENRNQLEYAVYDFRSAKKLAPNDVQVNKNLDRATTNWHNQLKTKISGHRREIAINPNIPINYLEIGKCYKNLGEWTTAEEWYDDYLKREEPSADEVIRYTEILAKNQHIEKGEKILKRFVEKYPKDHRLWSRYGYFTLWLGKKKIAEEAFKTALSFRPYFKEAMDGLEICQNRPYEYTIYDTTAAHRQKELEEKQKQFEYPIDRYYRLLKSNPADTSMRLTLAQALLDVNRLEESYQQLQILANDLNGQPRFTTLWDTVSARRERQIAQKTAIYMERFEKNNNDKEAAISLANLYSSKQDYEKATEILKKYLANKPTDQDPDVRYMLAKFTTWDNHFDDAIEQMNYLLAKDPNNLVYQLFRAQIAVWTWNDKELSEQYLDNVLKSEPDNLQALMAKATLLIRDRKFAEAEAIIKDARAKHPGAKEIDIIQNSYDSKMAQEPEYQNFQVLVSARETAAAGDCPGAIEKYNEYFSNSKAPSKLELIEFADVNSCAKNYKKALEIYDKLLAEEYDYDVALLKAKATLWGGDSISAKNQLIELMRKDTSNFDARFYLAEAYEHLKDIDSAKVIYDSLYVATPDSAKRDLITKRIGWLPAAASPWAFMSGFPTYVRVSPQLSFYQDNQDLDMLNTSMSVEFGLSSKLSVTLGLGRVFLQGRYSYMSNGQKILMGVVKNYFTTSKWQINYYISPTLFVFGGMGNLAYDNLDKKAVYEWGISLSKPKKYVATFLMQKTDAALLLYSSNLANPTLRYNAFNYRFSSWYQLNTLVKLMLNYSHIVINDKYVPVGDAAYHIGAGTYTGAIGDIISFKLAKKFTDEITAGYEYNYENMTPLNFRFYTPQGYAAHSLWGEYAYTVEDDFILTGGLKYGYVPKDDFFVRELSGGIDYKINNLFVLSGKLTVGESYRETSSYSYSSAFFSIYWNL